MAGDERTPETEVEGKGETPKQPLKAEGQEEPTLEQQYKDLEQKHKSLQGMYNPLKEKYDTLSKQGDLAQMFGDLKLAVERRFDQYEVEREEATLNTEEELEGSPKKTQIQQRRMAKGILSEHGLSTTDPKFDEALHSSDPVRAVSRILAQTRKEEAESFTQQMDKGMKELEDKLRAEFSEEQLRRESSAYKGETGSPTGGVLSDAEFMNKYGKGEVDDHKRAKEILEKMSKGG